MISKHSARLVNQQLPAAVGVICGVLFPAEAAVSQVALPPQSDISRQRVAPLPLPSLNYDFRIQNPEKSAVPRAQTVLAGNVKYWVEPLKLALVVITLPGSAP